MTHRIRPVTAGNHLVQSACAWVTGLRLFAMACPSLLVPPPVYSLAWHAMGPHLLVNEFRDDLYWLLVSPIRFKHDMARRFLRRDPNGYFRGEGNAPTVGKLVRIE